MGKHDQLWLILEALAKSKIPGGGPEKWEWEDKTVPQKSRTRTDIPDKRIGYAIDTQGDAIS